MAKALFGHVGGPDPRMVTEMRRLQQRVRDLEAELTRLQEENDMLAAETAHEDLLARDREPALALSKGERRPLARTEELAPGGPVRLRRGKTGKARTRGASGAPLSCPVGRGRARA
jgi:hypothetical protein